MRTVLLVRHRNHCRSQWQFTWSPTTDPGDDDLRSPRLGKSGGTATATSCMVSGVERPGAPVAAWPSGTEAQGPPVQPEGAPSPARGPSSGTPVGLDHEPLASPSRRAACGGDSEPLAYSAKGVAPAFFLDGLLTRALYSRFTKYCEKLQTSGVRGRGPPEAKFLGILGPLTGDLPLAREGV